MFQKTRDQISRAYSHMLVEASQTPEDRKELEIQNAKVRDVAIKSLQKGIKGKHKITPWPNPLLQSNIVIEFGTTAGDKSMPNVVLFLTAENSKTPGLYQYKNGSMYQASTDAGIAADFDEQKYKNIPDAIKRINQWLTERKDWWGTGVEPHDGYKRPKRVSYKIR